MGTDHEGGLKPWLEVAAQAYAFRFRNARRSDLNHGSTQADRGHGCVHRNACRSSAGPGRVYRVGYLGATSPRYDTPADVRVWNGFVLRLRELGFSEGDNTVIEQRFADGRNECYVDFAISLPRW